MANRYDEVINEIGYEVVTINLGKCKTHKDFIKQLYEGFNIPYETLNANLWSGDVDMLLGLSTNYKLVLQKAKILKERDAGLYESIIDYLRNLEKHWQQKKYNFKLELS